MNGGKVMKIKLSKRVLDTHGTAWKSLRPAWISARGLKRKINDNDVFIINVRKLEKLKFPFTT